MHRFLASIGSPVNNNFTETMDGNSTIRAFGSEESSNERNYQLMNAQKVGREITFTTWVWYSW